MAVPEPVKSTGVGTVELVVTTPLASGAETRRSGVPGVMPRMATPEGTCAMAVTITEKRNPPAINAAEHFANCEIVRYVFMCLAHRIPVCRIRRNKLDRSLP